jgi:outer membrane protein assembly factor BamB
MQKIALLLLISLLAPLVATFGQGETTKAGKPAGETDSASTSLLALPFVRKWQYLTDSPSPFPPLLDNSTIYLPLSGGRVLCLNRETGDLLWASDLGGIITTPVALNEKALFIATRKLAEDGSEGGAALRALDKSTGITLWARDYARPFTSPLTISGDRIYAGSADGCLYALSAGGGQVIWKAQTQDVVRGLALIAGDLIYFGSDDGALRVVETESGREVWKFQTGARVAGRPVSDDKMIYFGSGDGFVYAIDLATKKLRWRARTGAAIEASVVLAGDRLIVGSFDNFVYALARASGNRLWKRRLEGRIAASPLVRGDATLIAPLHSDYVAVFSNSDGRPLNFFRLDKGLEIVAAPALSSETLAIATDRGLIVATVAKSSDQPAMKK